MQLEDMAGNKITVSTGSFVCLTFGRACGIEDQNNGWNVEHEHNKRPRQLLHDIIGRGPGNCRRKTIYNMIYGTTISMYFSKSLFASRRLCPWKFIMLKWIKALMGN